MTTTQREEDEKFAQDYVTTNTSWDDYECDWVGTGSKLFLDGITKGRELERQRINQALDDEDLDRTDWSDDKKAGYALCRLGIIEAVLK